MQFEKRFKAGIREGLITTSFRAWKRPQAKVGGRYRVHPIGMIEVDGLGRCSRRDVSADDARRAGFESREALFEYLGRKSDVEGDLYRVDFHYAGSGEREGPDTSRLPVADLDALLARLQRMDRLSSRGPWTRETLAEIEARPATRAADLAKRVGFETLPFKTNVRKLKKLGLTISLETGYRLSPRGKQLMEHARKHTWS
jgi:hypothetical protein